MKTYCIICKEFKECHARGMCRKCYSKKWYIDNLKKVKAQTRKWRLKNSEKMATAVKKWRHDNPEKYKAWQKNYLAKNKEKRKAYNKKYRREHLEEQKAKGKKRYNEFSEEIKNYGKKYYQEHKEQRREYGRKYCQGHKEQRRVYSRKWQKANPGKIRENRLKRKTNGDIEKGIIAKIINENLFKYGRILCEACGEPCSSDYHIDHIIPISKGGSNDYGNLQLLCARCNLIKFTKIRDYRQSIENNQLYLK